MPSRRRRCGRRTARCSPCSTSCSVTSKRSRGPAASSEPQRPSESRPRGGVVPRHGQTPTVTSASLPPSGTRLPDEPLPPDQFADFVRTWTALRRPPSLPEVALHLADEVTRIWELTEEQMRQVGLDPPFWAFAWAGGQALARYLLDNPDAVAGRRVLDLATGSGMVAIAARLAGAASALAVDIDPFCAAAVEVNAAANGVQVDYSDRDLLSDDVGVLRVDPDLVGVEVILAGDVSYEYGMSGRMHRWLRAASAAGFRVLIGDPGRRYLPEDGLVQLAGYDIVTTPDLEESDLKRAAVYTYG